MYIHNVYTKKCYPMYIYALKCIYPMYINVTQCITPNVYTRQYTLGIYIVLHFLATSYIHWVTVYTLGCMWFLLPNVYTVYTLGHTYIHWDTIIYIWWHQYTLGIYIVLHRQCTYTLGNIGYIHCITLHKIWIMLHNVYYDVPQCILRCSPMYISYLDTYT